MMKSQDDDTVNTLKYYAGIDLGGTGIKCGIVNENGKIIAIKKCPTRKGVEAKEIISDMAHLVKDLQKETGLTLEGRRRLPRTYRYRERKRCLQQQSRVVECSAYKNAERGTEFARLRYERRECSGAR